MPERDLDRLRNLTNRSLVFVEGLSEFTKPKSLVSDLLGPTLVNIRRLLLKMKRLLGEATTKGKKNLQVLWEHDNRLGRAGPDSTLGGRLLAALFQSIDTMRDTEAMRSPHVSTLCEAIFSLVNEESKAFSMETKQMILERLLAADLALRCLGLSLWRQPHAKIRH